MKGVVYLVGAGPGDEGLISVRGLELLHRADAVVYDRLANSNLLCEAPPEALKIDAGKRKGESPRRQAWINEQLVRLAKRHRTVVRLKGGDPLIFARGGEEAEHLAANRVPFEIVPGVTAASALAYAGIPLTHRDWAPKLTLITGTLAAGRAPKVSDLPKEGTLVIYMGLSTLAETAQRLMDSGWPADTPSAVVSWASRPCQRVVEGTLWDIGKKVREAALESPALVVFGQVVSLRSKLSWFEKRPLFGKRVIVTRPEEQADEFVRMLRDAGAEVLRMPSIQVEPVAWKFRSPRDHQWLIFTSQNGVRLYFQRLFHEGEDVRALGNVKLGVIGDATAEVLAEFGLEADLIAEEFTTDRFSKALASKVRRGESVLYPCADVHNPEVAERVRKKGANIEEVVVYRVKPVRPKNMEEAATADIATFTSAMTAKSFFSAKPAFRGKIAAIGPATARAIEALGHRVDAVAKPHTLEGLFKAVVNHAR